jgi:uncharacterized protein with HEPN domain
MKRDARAFLWDIQQAADAILRFVAGLDIRTYAETELVQSAVERVQHGANRHPVTLETGT